MITCQREEKDGYTMQITEVHIRWLAGPRVR